MGENVIAVHVYYIGTINHAYQSGDLRQGLWAELCTAEGEVVFESNRSWKALHPLAWERTKVTGEGYNVQFQESIDAAQLPFGWENIIKRRFLILLPALAFVRD